MKTAALVIAIMTSGGAANKYMEHPMPTMDECLRVLEQTKIHTPEHADDNEWVVVATCKFL